MTESLSIGAAFRDPLIVGGQIDNTPIGSVTPSTGVFTTATAATVKATSGAVLPKSSGAGIKVDTTSPAYTWRDLIGVVQARSATGDAPAMYQYRGGNISEFAFALNNSENFEFHMPHDYVPGSDLYIHVHWSHNGTAISGQIQFTFSTSYSKGHNQAIFPAETTTLTVSTPNVATIPQYEHRIEEIQLSATSPTANQIDTALLEVDGILLVNMKTSAIPTISGGSITRPFVHFVDIHYQSTNIGTKQKAPNFYV